MVILKKHFNNIFRVIFCTIATLGMLYLNSEFDAYHPSPLQYHGSIVEPFRNEGVHITASVYDREASKNYLHRDLFLYGYQPIQITIQNNTAQTYFFAKYGVDLKSASFKDVTSKITLHAMPRSIAFKIVSFFFWPFIVPST